MPLIENLKNPFEKMILTSPLHGLLSDDLALISFVDALNGRKLSFAVEYQWEKRFVRIVCSRKENCWRKFIFGSPVEILIQGINYRGWAEIIDDPDEMVKEWTALFKHVPQITKGLGIDLTGEDDFGSQKLLDLQKEYAVLRIDISGVS